MDSLIKYCKDRLKQAGNLAYRKEMAEGKLKDADKYFDKLKSDHADEAAEFIAQYQDLRKEAEGVIEEYWRKREMDEADRKTQSYWKSYKTNFDRFPDRSQKYLDDLLKVLPIYEKYGLTLVVEDWKKKVKKADKELKEREIRKKIEREYYYVESALKSAYNEYDRYQRAKEMANYVEKALDIFQKKIESNEDFMQTGDLLEGYREKFYAVYMDYKKKVVMLGLMAEIKKAGESMVSMMGFAKSYWNYGKNHGQSWEKHEKAKDMYEEFMSHTDWLELEKAQYYIDQYEKKRIDFETYAHEEQLKEDIRNDTQRALNVIGFCSTYLRSSEARAQEYFEQASELANDISENKRYEGRKEIDEFFKKFYKKSHDYQKAYEEQVVNDMMRKAKSDASNNLGFARSYSTDTARQLDFLAIAKDKLVDIQTNDLLMKQTEMQEWVEKFQTEIDAMELKIQDKILETEAKKARDNVDLRLSWASSKSHAYSYGAALECIEEASELYEDMLGNPILAEHDLIKEYSTKYESKRASLLKEIKDKMFQEEKVNATNAVSTSMAGLDSYIKAHQFEKALETLDRGQDAVLNLEINFAEQCADLIEEQNKKIDAKRLEINEAMLVEDLKKAFSNATTPLSHANSYLDRHEPGRALDYLEQARDAKSDAEFNSSFMGRKELEEFLAKFEKDEAEFLNKFADQELKDVIKKKTEGAKTCLSHARSYFNSHNYSRSLGYLEEAKEKLGDIMDDQQLQSLQTIQEFVEQFEKDMMDFENECHETMQKEAMKERVGKVTTVFGFCRTYFPNHPDRAQEYLEQAKDALDDIRFEDAQFMPENFIDNMDKKIMDFEIEFDEEFKKKEIRNAQSKITTRIGNSDGYVRSNKSRAMQYLEEAQELLSNFILDYPKQEEFIDEQGKKIQEKMSKIHKELEKEEIKKQKDMAQTLFNNAKSAFSSYRESQAFDYLERAEDQLDNVAASEKSWIDNLQKQIEKLRQEIVEKAFAEEVKKAMDKANLLLNNARIYLKSFQNERALDYLQRAREASHELGADKYMGLSQVDEFFTKFNKEWETIMADFNSVLFGKAMKEAKQNVTMNLSHAETYFKSHRHNQSLEYLEKAKDNLEEFEENPDFQTESKFVEEYKEKIQTFEQTFTEHVHTNEVKSKIGQADQVFKQAETSLKYNAFDRALSNFQKAQDAVSELEQYKEHSLAKEFLQSYQEKASQFEKTYADLALKKEARKLVQSVNDCLRIAKVLLGQGMKGKVLEQIEKMYGLQSDANQMLAQVEIVKSAFQSVKDFQAEFASQMLKDEADLQVKHASKLLEKAKTQQSRGLKDQTKELMQQLHQDYFSTLFNTESNFSSLAPVQEFRGKAIEFAKTLKIDLTKSPQKEEKKKSGGGKGPSGELFAAAGALEAIKLQSLQMSTSIKSSLFGALKKFNEVAGRANGGIRKFLREFKQIDLFQGGYQGRFYALEDLDRYPKDLDRAESMIEEKDQEDDNAKHIIGEIKKYRDWLQGVKDALKLTTDIQMALGATRALNARASRAYESGLGQIKGTFPNQSDPIMIQTPDRRGFTSDKYMDSEVFYKSWELTQEGEEKSKYYSEKYKGWPHDDFKTKFDELGKKALIEHVKHCMRAVSYCHTPEHQRMYLVALRRWPLARKYAMESYRQNKYLYYLGQMRRIHKDERWAIKDPYANEEQKDAFPEKDEDYQSGYERIQPGDPSHPSGPYPNESDNPLYWNALKKENAGKIVFSKNDIDKNESDVSKLTNSFVYGEDEIHARAIWPQTIHNYALAKDKDGKLVYGPERAKNVLGNAAHTTELLFFVKIDGKQIETNQRLKCFHYDEERNTDDKDYGQRVNFYHNNQSIKLFVSKKKIDWFDFYERESVCRFHSEFQKLSPGKHQVEIELKFRIRGTVTNRTLAKPNFPSFVSKLSHTISQGSFEVTIPENAKMPHQLPVRTSPLSSAPKIEAAILGSMRESGQWGKRSSKREQVLKTWCTSDIYVTRTHWFTEKPIQYGTNLTAAIYRTPEDGWAREEVALFRLSTYTQVYKEEAQKMMPPCYGIGVGGNATFDPEWVPEEFLKGIKRCDAKWKSGLHHLTDEDRLMYHTEGKWEL